MMVHRIIKFFVLTIFALSISTCYYDNEEDLYGDSQCDATNVTYSDVIEPIIQSKCATTGCHVAGGTGTGLLESYANVKAKVDDGSFFDRVITQRDMPPGSPLNDCQILVIEKWISDGAPNN